MKGSSKTGSEKDSALGDSEKSSEVDSIAELKKLVPNVGDGHGGQEKDVNIVQNYIPKVEPEERATPQNPTHLAEEADLKGNRKCA